MTRKLLSAALVLAALSASARAEEYVPPPADRVPGYSADLLPCRIEREDRERVVCKDGLLEKKTMQQLSIARNTIFARYGWAGFRKPWLKTYFAAQPWFKPNPKFTYKLLSDIDRKNAHFIAVREQSMTSDELSRLKDDVLARHGKVWNDKPEWHTKDGKTVKACAPPKNVVDDEKDQEEYGSGSRDCRYAKQSWYKPNPNFDEKKDLTAGDKVELGLVSRAMGSFALDDEARAKSEGESLDRVLKPEELRQLSMRDLRLLRNTIYARKGRAFKSTLLQEHFNGMDWYKKNPDYSDKLLSKNDQRNIALIKSVENEFGGPLSDEDFLHEPAVDGA